jgi:hypothetical protein
VIRHWIRIHSCPGHRSEAGGREVHVAVRVPVSLRVGAVEYEIGELPAGTGTVGLPGLLRAVADQVEFAADQPY